MDLKLVIDGESAGKRLDQILKNSHPDISRSRIQKLIHDGNCLVDGSVQIDPAKKLFAGQVVEISFPEHPATPLAEDGRLNIIWHDDAIVICDKEPNLTVHPCPSCPGNTLVQRLLGRFPSLACQDGMRPGIVHRIDKDTSGLIAVALTESSRIKLAEAFAQKKIGKEYIALVSGVIPAEGQCEEPIGRDPHIKIKMAALPEKKGGKPAKSQWRRLWHNDRISLVAIKIFSGRTHQIRVHLACHGFPILGDKLYAPPNIQKMAPRQMLHAWQLWFDHPHTGKPLHFAAPPPQDFLDAAISNSKIMKRIVITGNQGCGKSSFRKLLEKEGLPAISADSIVGQLYSANGYVSGWIKNNLGNEALLPNGSVNKKALFDTLASNPGLRHDFENIVHSLVADRIEKFWEEQELNSSFAAVAEIPLYLECGWQNLFTPRPMIIGIHCDKAKRWERIIETRGWDINKISTLEQWQWPESKKMSACDLVIDNNGSLDELAANSHELILELEHKELQAKHKLLSHLLQLCNVDR